MMSLCMMLGLALVSIAFSACDRSFDYLDQQEIPSSIDCEGMNLDKYNQVAKTKYSRLSFPVEKLFVTIPEYLGKSKKLALVPLLFDKQGFLCTPQEYNSRFNKIDSISCIWTDLETFYNVTGFPYATEEYIKEAISDLYLFDPYQKDYQKEDFVRDEFRSTRVREGCDWQDLKEGDILYTSDSKTAYIPHGHVAGVVDEVRSSPARYKQVRLVEAISPRVVESPMGNWWTSRSSVQRLTLNRSILPSRRQELVRFLRSKIGEPYYSKVEFIADQTNFEGVYKYDTGKWYCSKLIWAAYYSVFGIDLDSDGGYIVYPRDILRSPSIYSENVSF